jgi:hypothetical protein
MLNLSYISIYKLRHFLNTGLWIWSPSNWVSLYLSMLAPLTGGLIQPNTSPRRSLSPVKVLLGRLVPVCFSCIYWLCRANVLKDSCIHTHTWAHTGAIAGLFPVLTHSGGLVNQIYYSNSLHQYLITITDARSVVSNPVNEQRHSLSLTHTHTHTHIHTPRRGNRSV